MTAVVESPAASPPATAPVRKRRRWHRIAIPFAVFLTLAIGTFVLHSMNEPSPTDPSFLAPSLPPHPKPYTATVLAHRLADRGVRVQVVSQTSEALAAAVQGDVTLFVPSPSLMHRDYLNQLWSLPSTTRVVLVDPSAGDLARGNAPISVTGRRWATAAIEAGSPPCAIAGLDAAGKAAVRHSRYAGNQNFVLREQSCYQSSVFEFHWTTADMVAVGSVDPFRDDRIDEYDNSTLALGLLSAHPTVIWLDVHKADAGPRTGASGPPSLAAPSDNPEQGAPGDGGSGNSDPTEGPSGRPQPVDSGGTEASGPSFFDAFPSAMWATLVGGLLLGLMLALWQARRLGPPVTEPLPFTVKGAETVLGRARLYQRAGAVVTGAQTLRRAIGPQIAQALGMPPTATPEDLATEITERYGGEHATYLGLLADDVPKKDSDLVLLAANLDSLLAMVSEPTSQGETRG
jgi:hypothetical protein